MTNSALNATTMNLFAIRPQRKLSIVHISTLEKDGGAARVAWRLYKAQRSAGHQSAMIVGTRKTTDQNIYAMQSQANPELLADCEKQGLLYYEIRASHDLVHHPLIQSCDIIHVHNLHGNYFNPFSLALLGRLKPVVWTLHDMQSITGHCAHSFDCERWQTGCGNCPYLKVYPVIPIDATRRLWADKKMIYTHTPFQVTVPSMWLKSKVSRSILSDHPIELIYNGVDTTVFKPYDRADMRRRFNLPQDAVIIGGVANGGALRNGWKGGIYTIEVIKALSKQVPECYFLNIGAASPSDFPNVINVAAVDDENDLARLYSALDVYLMTSIAENCPLVVLEALACGIPVVSFATGGVPELVSNGETGHIVDYKDIAGMIKVLIQFARQRHAANFLQQNARQRAQSLFDHNLIARRFEILYHRYIHQFRKDLELFNPLPLTQVPEIIKCQSFLDAFNQIDSRNAGCQKDESKAVPMAHELG